MKWFGHFAKWLMLRGLLGGMENSSTFALEEIKESKSRLMAQVNSRFVKMLIVLFIGGVRLIT
jgi:hypothetical protein